MTPQEKAEDLIQKFIPRVYCYMGSGMLTNDYDNDIATKNAIYQSIICVDELIKSYPKHPSEIGSLMPFVDADKYWREVRQILQSKQINYESNK